MLAFEQSLNLLASLSGFQSRHPSLLDAADNLLSSLAPGLTTLAASCCLDKFPETGSSRLSPLVHQSPVTPPPPPSPGLAGGGAQFANIRTRRPNGAELGESVRQKIRPFPVSRGSAGVVVACCMLDPPSERFGSHERECSYRFESEFRKCSLRGFQKRTSSICM